MRVLRDFLLKIQKHTNCLYTLGDAPFIMGASKEGTPPGENPGGTPSPRFNESPPSERRTGRGNPREQAPGEIGRRRRKPNPEPPEHKAPENPREESERKTGTPAPGIVGRT